MQEKLLPVSLAKLQREFQAILHAAPSKFVNLVSYTANGERESRLKIYADGYFYRLHEVLAANYPRLFKYLGSADFYTLAKTYIYKYPSTFRSIRYFGNQLGNFLELNQPYIDQPILAEIAKFDWAIEDIFDVVDKDVFTIEDLYGILPEQWPTMRFRFHPSLRRETFNYNTLNIWELIAKHDDNNSTHENYMKVKKLQSPQSVLFWRKNLDVLYRSLSELESFSLDLALNGFSFGSICEEICQFVSEPEAAGVAAKLLMQWIVDGIVIDMHLS